MGRFELAGLIPPEAVEVALTLFLSFLVGLEREEQKFRTRSYHFGGVRTFPLLGLIGLLLTKLFPHSPPAVLIGLVVIGPFLILSYYYKLTKEQGGFTSEMSGLIAYLSGALVGEQLYWIAATVVILNVLLLQAKEGLERLGEKIPSWEINTFLRFLLLTAVLLPIVPNEPFSRFAINPFTIWLIVVAVCGISYATYLLQWLLKSRAGVFLSALLGGAYSSTITTVVVAKKSKEDSANPVYPYAIAGASCLMYARSALWLALFSPALFGRMGWYFTALCAIGVVASYLGMRWKRGSAAAQGSVQILENRNPLEFSTAFAFAALLLLIIVATRLATQQFGHLGTYVVGALAGFVNPDPFIIGLAHSFHPDDGANILFNAILLSTSCNNLIKGVYALVFGDRRVGALSFVFLALLTLASLPVLFLR